MAIRAKAEPLDSTIELFYQEDLSPEARAETLAKYAALEITEAQQSNEKILGQIPPPRIVVDGQQGKQISAVKPDGTVFAEFMLYEEVVQYISSQLYAHSPVLTGRYQKSHVLFADGVEIDPAGPLPPADEYTFVNSQPYARKIERGLSSQSPEGVYQVVAVLAQRRFGNNIARIRYTFRGAVGGAFGGGGKRTDRNPAIVVKIR